MTGHLQFSTTRQWQEVTLKITSRLAVVEIHSLATNQTVHVKITSDGEVMERDLTFAELQNPDALVRALTGNFADTLFGDDGSAGFHRPSGRAEPSEWSASRTRVKIGTEAVPVYRLETTRARPCQSSWMCSTLGEILRVELPGNISARIDEWSQP